MFDLDWALRFGAALGLGLLLGLERERQRDAELLFGGIRTFALIALISNAFVLAIMVAWTIMFLRVVLMVSLVNNAMARGLAEDFREGVRAFAEKRRPVWRGR